jgi:NTP pyrophosphatase (non-canonical NTP hydrolase)
MFDQIYPSNSRTLAEAGVHLAEEMGELSEAIHIYLGEHHGPQFKDIEDEAADYLSCLFGVANSAKIDIALQLESFFYKNCHVCHNLPCSCNFSFVSRFRS